MSDSRQPGRKQEKKKATKKVLEGKQMENAQLKISCRSLSKIMEKLLIDTHSKYIKIDNDSQTQPYSILSWSDPSFLHENTTRTIISLYIKKL